MRKRERERPLFPVRVRCIHGVFSRKWDEKGQKQREAEGQREREGERNRSQVRVHFDNVTTTGCMRRTITSVYIVSAFRFFFLSLFFFFAALTRLDDALFAKSSLVKSEPFYLI